MTTVSMSSALERIIFLTILSYTNHIFCENKIALQKYEISMVRYVTIVAQLQKTVKTERY